MGIIANAPPTERAIWNSPGGPHLENITMDKCSATFEFANGHVARCELETGHVFEHVGWVLGSRTRWSQGTSSEYEEHMKELREDAKDWQNRSVEDMPEVISPDELKEWTDKVWQGVFDYDD